MIFHGNPPSIHGFPMQNPWKNPGIFPFQPLEILGLGTPGKVGKAAAVATGAKPGEAQRNGDFRGVPWGFHGDSMVVIMINHGLMDILMMLRLLLDVFISLLVSNQNVI